MTARLYFLLPDIKTAHKVEEALLVRRINEHDIHFHAKVASRLGDLPRAGFLQRTDIKHGMMVGLIAGGITGAILGFALSYLPGIGETFGIATDGKPALGLAWVLALALIGALVGSWAASLIAISVPNSRLKPFAQSIQEGQILLMVDVPQDRAEEVTNLIKQHCPEVKTGGSDPTVPAFP